MWTRHKRLLEGVLMKTAAKLTFVLKHQVLESDHHRNTWIHRCGKAAAPQQCQRLCNLSSVLPVGQIMSSRATQQAVLYLRMYSRWSSCTLYLHACQVRVTVGDSVLCCCVCVTSFESWLTPLCVDPPGCSVLVTISVTSTSQLLQTRRVLTDQWHSFLRRKDLRAGGFLWERQEVDTGHPCIRGHCQKYHVSLCILSFHPQVSLCGWLVIKVHNYYDYNACLSAPLLMNAGHLHRKINQIKTSNTVCNKETNHLFELPTLRVTHTRRSSLGIQKEV